MLRSEHIYEHNISIAKMSCLVIGLKKKLWSEKCFQLEEAMDLSRETSNHIFLEGVRFNKVRIWSGQKWFIRTIAMIVEIFQEDMCLYKLASYDLLHIWFTWYKQNAIVIVTAINGAEIASLKVSGSTSCTRYLHVDRKYVDWGPKYTQINNNKKKLNENLNIPQLIAAFFMDVLAPGPVLYSRMLAGKIVE